MSLESKFWRLLGDYEGLTRAETSALMEFNFPELSGIHKKKPLIFRELVKIGKILGLDRRDFSLRRRLTLLVEVEQRNSEIAQDFLSKARYEQHSLDLAAAQLRAFEQVYVKDLRDAALESSFCEHV